MTIAAMATTPAKQLDRERRDWIRRHVEQELIVWERITRRLALEGFDQRSAEYRRAWDVYVALKNTGQQHRPRSAGIWSASMAAAVQTTGQLTRDQSDALGAAAMAAIRELAPAVAFMDSGGFPCKLLAASVRKALERCEAINLLLGALERHSSGSRVPEPPADPTLHLGEGI